MATGGQRVMWCGYWPISRQHGDVMPSSSHGKTRHEIHLYNHVPGKHVCIIHCTLHPHTCGLTMCLQMCTCIYRHHYVVKLSACDAGIRFWATKSVAFSVWQKRMEFLSSVSSNVHTHQLELSRCANYLTANDNTLGRQLCSCSPFCNHNRMHHLFATHTLELYWEYG